MSLSSTITDGLKNKIPGISQEQLKSLTNADSLKSLASSMEQQVAEEFKNLTSSASGALNSSLNQIASSFPDAAKSLFATSDPLSKSLSSYSAELTKGAKETSSKVTSLASDAAQAIAKPVSFVSKPIDTSIQGTDTMAKGTSLKDYKPEQNKEETSILSKATGWAVETSSDVAKAIKDITGDLSEKISGVVSEKKELLSGSLGDVIGPATSEVKDFAGSLMGGVKSATSTVFGGEGIIGSAIEYGKELSDDCLDLLPKSAQTWIKKKSTSAITDAATEILGGKLSTVNSLMNMLPGISSSDSMLEKVLKLGDGTVYSKFTDLEGIPIPGLGNNSSEDINTLYQAASSICKNVKAPNLINNRDNKDLFDILCLIASEKGLTSLLKQLSECAAGQNTYLDQRTVKLLSGVTSTLAKDGNADSYKGVLDIVGISNIKNPVSDLLKLTANASDSKENKSALDSVFDSFKLSTDDIIADTNAIVNSISAEKVVMGSASSDKFLVSDNLSLPEIGLTKSLFNYSATA